MSDTLHIPLFPLGSVLFPGGQLPLQIFEVRYLDMIKRCVANGSPFGVVCQTQGHEVQQAGASDSGFRDEIFAPLGTLAHIAEWHQPQAGLMMVRTEGRERFTVQRSERLKHGLWMADVTMLAADMAMPVPPELVGLPQRLHQLHSQVQQQQPGMLPPYPPYHETTGPWADAGWVANRWTELLPIDAEAKQRLLALDSPLLRLELVGDMLDQLGLTNAPSP